MLVWYPSVEHEREDYVKPAVRIEAGAKSALDPDAPATIVPYVAEDIADLDLAVAGVTTIIPERTFWDKIVIAHGLRRWFERRGQLRNEGQRISRHYYHLHCLARSAPGSAAMADAALGADCVQHARTFFDRPDCDLASASQGMLAAFLESDRNFVRERDARVRGQK